MGFSAECALNYKETGRQRRRIGTVRVRSASRFVIAAQEETRRSGGWK